MLQKVHLYVCLTICCFFVGCGSIGLSSIEHQQIRNQDIPELHNFDDHMFLSKHNILINSKNDRNTFVIQTELKEVSPYELWLFVNKMCFEKKDYLTKKLLRFVSQENLAIYSCKPGSYQHYGNGLNTIDEPQNMIIGYIRPLTDEQTIKTLFEQKLFEQHGRRNESITKYLYNEDKISRFYASFVFNHGLAKYLQKISGSSKVMLFSSQNLTKSIASAGSTYSGESITDKNIKDFLIDE